MECDIMLESILVLKLILDKTSFGKHLLEIANGQMEMIFRKRNQCAQTKDQNINK